jgi:S-adenosylmethionine hydrolase
VTRADESGGPPTVFFLSDYGLSDEFVGVVHAVLARLAPGVRVIDLVHDLAPFDVRGGASALVRALPYLGPGTVLAVVDPGVGTGRRAVAVEAGPADSRRVFVGPDNGLLMAAVEAAGGPVGAVALDRPGAGAVTFDGRDVFAPAVAAVCRGEPVESLGTAVEPARLVRLAPPVAEITAEPAGRTTLRAEVTWIDRFGNVALAAAAGALPEPGTVFTVYGTVDGGASGQVVRAFGDLADGALGALGDSSGAAALLVAQGSAAARLGLRPGSVVRVVW